MKSFDINLAGEALKLLPSKALFWPKEKILFVADLHLGKSASQRHKNFFLPEGSDQDDLESLNRLIQDLGPEHLIILGDLFHDKFSLSDELVIAFHQWRERIDHEMTLVLGNHDRKAEGSIFDLPLNVKTQSYPLGPFWLSHEPENQTDKFNLCGHLHPGIRLKDNAGCAHAFKAFWHRKEQLVLPAYGSTTSLGKMPAEEEDLFYVCSDRDIVKMRPPEIAKK
ncbi:MAG: ligase-associated DNA damage response endonuclease PdeM [Opitutales bacterium]